MGIIFGIPIFGFLVFGPAFFVIRSKTGTSTQRIAWAALTVSAALAFALIVGLFVHLVGTGPNLTAVERRFGWLEYVSLAGTVGFFAIPWMIYALFKRKHSPERQGGDSA